VPVEIAYLRYYLFLLVYLLRFQGLELPSLVLIP